MSAETRLATYGTLAPGRLNHRQLAALRGKWCTGMVRGRLIEEGWGAANGCPGLVLDAGGQAVEVFLFVSPDLPDHWTRLDKFEGADYRRVRTQIETSEGFVEAFIYALNP